jgi:hypothetical protein
MHSHSDACGVMTVYFAGEASHELNVEPQTPSQIVQRIHAWWLETPGRLAPLVKEHADKIRDVADSIAARQGGHKAQRKDDEYETDGAQLAQLAPCLRHPAASLPVLCAPCSW